ncbi:lipase 1 [[Candida] anglica]|uniref:Lipase 1 n=1 Tax=[Candida] anglica TaxID=148631 RepID=A0ABP0EQV0_9ASCO
MRFILGLYIFFFAAIVASAPYPTVLPPSVDPFYDIPDELESKNPGDILKFRKSPHRIRSIFLPVDVKNAWQMMVRSTDSHGNATAIVTTLIEPFNSNSSRLLQYQIAEDSGSVDCSASYSFLFGASPDTLAAQAEMYFIQIALNEGWWVNVPDYEGPKAAFTAGRQAGHAVLDTLRGVLKNTNDTGLNPEPEVVMWGYSGGSLATGWAAALQPLYAPDLSPRIIGAALGGFASNITTTIIAIDGGFYTGLVATGVTGLSNEYPQLKPIIQREVPEKFKWIYDKAGKTCLLPSILYGMYAQVFRGSNRWIQAGYSLLSEPVVADVLHNVTLGISKEDFPEIPIFIYHGMKDNIVPYINTERIYDTWCSWGIKSLEVAASENTRHVTEMVGGAPAAFAWVSKRFNGESTVDGCSLTKRSTNLQYPGVSMAIVETLQAAAKSILQFKIGPSSPTLDKRGLIDYDMIVEAQLAESYKKRTLRY